MASHAANGRTELQMMREDYLSELRAYSQMVGTLYPGIIYKQLLAMRQRYAEAGGNIDDLGSLHAPNQDGRAPFISGIPSA